MSLPAGWRWGAAERGKSRVATWNIASRYFVKVKRSDEGHWAWWLEFVDDAGKTEIVDSGRHPSYMSAYDACTRSENPGARARLDHAKARA